LPYGWMRQGWCGTFAQPAARMAGRSWTNRQAHAETVIIMYLIYFSPVRWFSHGQRPHEMVRYFHEVTGGRVMWIDPYPGRFPRLQDWPRPQVKDEDQGLTDWLEVFSPPSLPFDLLPFGPQIGRNFFWRDLLDRLARIGAPGGAMAIGVGKPSALALGILRNFRKASSFFDVMDNLPAFYRGFSGRKMASMEMQVLGQVGRVFTSSAPLFARLKSIGAQAVLIRNGCAANRMPAPRPPTLPGSGTLGFIGTIGDWFDWEITVKLARAIPDSCIKIVGPVHRRPPHWLPQNIALAPPCSHQKAFTQMSSFKIGLIPFRRNQLTETADPIKYYEYRAMGLPVLTTAFGGMAGHKSDPGLFCMTDASDFAPAVTAACSHQDTPEAVAQFRQENSWERRFASAGLFSWL